MNDEQREQLIKDCLREMNQAAIAKDDERILHWATEMTRLINGRSQQQVNRMEAAKGLR